MTYSLQGNTVYVIEPTEDGALTANARVVRAGKVRDGRVAVLDGVKCRRQSGERRAEQTVPRRTRRRRRERGAVKPRFTDLFVQRPVLALVLSAVMLLVGIQAGTQLSLRQYPEVEKSVIFVNTVYPGASAETVQGFVTTPLQRRIAAAKGVEFVTSQSDPGVSQIEANVRLGENSTDVLGEVITKVNEARFELPRDVEDPVVSNRTGGDAMMYMALLSEEMSVQQRADYAMRFIQPVLSTVEGVGEARVLGSGNFAMRIWLNPTKMAAFGVTAIDVDDAVRRDNYISAAGTTRGELRARECRCARPISRIRSALPQSWCARTAIGASRSATSRRWSLRAKRTSRPCIRAARKRCSSRSPRRPAPIRSR